MLKNNKAENEELCTRIKSQLKKLNISQVELGENLGISLGVLNNYLCCSHGYMLTAILYIKIAKYIKHKKRDLNE